LTKGHLGTIGFAVSRTKCALPTFVSGLHELDFSPPCHSVDWVYLFPFETLTL